MFSDADTARESIREQVDELCAEIARLKARQDELLATIVRLTHDTPYDDEAAAWPVQRAKLTAAVGTMRAKLTQAREMANWVGRLTIAPGLPSAVWSDLCRNHSTLRFLTNDEGETNDGTEG